METARIDVKDLAFGYGGGPPVFEGVSLTVHEGEVLCLLGPNGTGKSTLLRCMMGLLRPKQGQVYLEGWDLRKLDPRQVAKRVGYVPQSQASTFPFTIRDVVVMGRAPHISTISSPSETDWEAAGRAMDMAGIAHLAQRICHGVSGGEWQLALIARALAQEPKALILDEPTSHLDMGNQARILGVIRELARQGLSIVMASHFPDHAFLAADRAAFLKDGRLLAFGEPDRVLTAERLRDVYGPGVRILEPTDSPGRKTCLLGEI